MKLQIRSHPSSTVWLLIVLLLCLGGASTRASIYSQSVIDAAVAQPLLDFANDLENAPMPQARAINFMALVVYQDPAATSPAGGALVRARLLAQIRSLITGGKEPNANGSLSGWTHGSIANAFVLAKNTPSVWSQLTATEKAKIDWLMKGMAIAGHFCFDDGNDFRTGLGHEGNFYKLSNPNFREGYVGVIVAATLYFGSTELNNIFTTFNFTTFTNQFASYGFNNILARWGSYNWKPILENGGSDGLGGSGLGVKNTFTYKGVAPTDPFGIFKKLADYMYGTPDYSWATNYPWTQSSAVINGLTINGTNYSWTQNNGNSPYLGQLGMCFEFHSTDGSGAATKPRSSIVYVTEAWNNSVCTRATLESLGYWTGAATDINDVESRMRVGSDDLIYKAQQGFVGYNSGGQAPPYNESNLTSERGYNFTKETWLKLLKDTTAPSVSITAPTSGAYVRGTAVTVSANATDNRNIVGVQFKLDGANLGSEDTTSPYSISWNTTSTGNGNHTLTAVARDVAGNTTTSAPITVTVDNAAPTVSISSPSNGAYVRGTALTVSASASDNIGVAGVQFKLDGVNLGSEDTTSPFSIAWNTTTAANGSHSLTGVARDAAGNSTTSPAVTVTVDNSAPAVSISAPANGAMVSGTAVAVSATASDNIGVVGVQFKLDGANLGAEDTTSPFSINWDTTTAPSGPHSLTAVARDMAGNSTTSAAIAVTVNNGCYTALPGGGWVNVSIDNQAATFTAEFDATPGASAMNSVMGLANGLAGNYTNLAANVRFNSTNTIDARNGAVYSAASTIPYSANQEYHFRLVVNIPSHTYSAYVTPAGGSEQVIGVNYSFRTEQASVSQLNNLGIYSTTNGANTVCDVIAYDSALKAWLKFDETGGTTAYDSSKNTNNGALVNGPVWTAGGLGGALDFDGAEDLVTVAASASLTNLSRFTYAAWIYPVSWGEGTYGRIVSRELTGLDEFYFHVQLTNSTLLAVIFNSTNASFASTAQANALTLNAWQHVAATYDNTGDRKIHLYINGVEVIYQTQAPVTGTLKLTTNPLRIGNRVATDRTFDGAIDDLRIYNRVLTQQEIQALP